jgi:hypothetical protein
MINITLLKKIQPFLNIRRICLEAGLNYQTIQTKLSKQTELNIEQSKALTKSLKILNIEIEKAYEQNF